MLYVSAVRVCECVCGPASHTCLALHSLPPVTPVAGFVAYLSTKLERQMVLLVQKDEGKHDNGDQWI